MLTEIQSEKLQLLLLPSLLQACCQAGITPAKIYIKDGKKKYHPQQQSKKQHVNKGFPFELPLPNLNQTTKLHDSRN